MRHNDIRDMQFDLYDVPPQAVPGGQKLMCLSQQREEAEMQPVQVMETRLNNIRGSICMCIIRAIKVVYDISRHHCVTTGTFAKR